ncbi:DUF262 domain-containing protein [Phaeobacter gallaeciensis]|uniref:DUF262 domain-containing protein n=1 Tax=Phaeobacter gallaeciensis TaxID=60890 RepID=UPI00237F217D|nr:DUF262 domain-containing protein [Phaeobacter gallaeciensis]MDE4063247.1 DUF262 domain-containing protein [Phaeobacter gallaeciensis]MDE4126263.1 DUF262 domain-containing protein [Phaeobacter gallaeciensis]MDE4130687.1 DUF262 domain-containing protein [Phaeobacter gallaeciensis]
MTTEAIQDRDSILLEGERIDFGANAGAPLEEISDSETNEKYIKGEIRIVTEQARYPIINVSKIVSDKSYRISPEYQRRHRWSADRKSKLIESLIMNVPIPPIFLYEYDYSKYEVMDGLQRLTAIHEFYSDAFALESLTEWSELNGKKYSTLPEKVREGIDRRYLSSVILLKETARDEGEALRLKQLVFERINSGGVKLEGQETRNAIFDGPLNQLCIRLSRNSSLCRLWGIPEATDEEANGGKPSQERVENKLFREMTDVELVLRFFAYRQKHRLQKSGESLGAYFDRFLREGNQLENSTLSELAQLFEKTIDLTERLLGTAAFYLYRKRTRLGDENWAWRDSPTTTIYDPMMFALSLLLDREAELLEKQEDIKNKLSDFYKENYSTFEGRNVNPAALIEREEKLYEYFKNFVSEK